jgi:hypothetical protein
MIGAAGAATARARLNQETMIGSRYAWCTEIHATWATTAIDPVNSRQQHTG